MSLVVPLRKCVEGMGWYQPPPEGRVGRLRLDLNENLVGPPREALRALAALQRNVSAAAGSPAAGPPRGDDEERLLDLDLVLLDKVAGLQTPIEALSAGVLTAQEGAALVDEAIRELSGLWGRRTLLLAGLESGGTDAGTGDSQ